MPRYIREEMINKPADFVDFIMKDFLNKHGFVLKTVKGEQVYQDGLGMVSIPRFFKYYYVNGIIHLEAWTKTAWFPGVYGKRENDLRGYVGSIPKQAYRNDIEELIKVLYQPLPSDQPYQNQNPYYGQPGMNQNPYYEQPGMNQNPYYDQQNGPIVVKGVDTKNLTTIGFVFSILAIPLCFLNVFTGLLFAMIGTAYCYKSLNSSQKGLANAGFVIGIIGLIFAAVCMIGYFMR